MERPADWRSPSDPSPSRAARVPSPEAISPTVRDPNSDALARPSALPLPGRVAGYEILGVLGEGGMGVVYRARQFRLDRVVALKMILAPSGAVERDRFCAEAETVARLRHPNIVQVYEVGEHDGLPFMALEYIEGGSLDRLLAGKPLPPGAAAALVETLARAIHHAHENGIVHRDLKPANVLLASPARQGRENITAGADARFAPGADATGLARCQAKISDFGLAKRLDRAGRTQPGLVVGTPEYMAPEQARGAHAEVGPAVDVYALGAILYECLTGRPPFHAATVWEVLEQVRECDPLPPRLLQPGAPRDLETIALKCLEKEPPRRYATARELADDLRRFAAHEPIQARPVGLLERAGKWTRRRPTAAALVGVCVLLAAVVAGAVPLHIARLRARVAQASAAVLHERDLSRRSALRAECLQRLADGRERLARASAADTQEAQLLGATVQELIGDRDARADPELARLRDEAGRLRAQASQVLRRLVSIEPARRQARRFLALRDEAFFELHRDLLASPDPTGPARAARAAHQALAAFPELEHLPPAEAHRLRDARREVWLVLTEARARAGASSASERSAHLQAALDLLHSVAGPTPMHGVHRLRARYLGQLGDRAGAAREQRRAEALPPRGALDWFLVGHDHFTAGRAAEAAAAFERVLAEQPDQFWARLLRALTCQQLDDLATARAELGLCIQQRPDFPWSYLLCASLYGRLGEFDRAGADLDRAAALPLGTAARYVLHLNRGVVELQRGHPRAAVAPFQHAIFLQPGRHHAHANLALAYWGLGDLDRAAAVLDHAVRLAPQHPVLRRDRARLRRQRGDLAGALADLDRLIRLGRDVQPADHVQRGRLLLRRGRHADALQAAGTALRLGEPSAHRLRGEALLALGRPRQAAAALSRAIAPGSTDVELFRLRARARAQSGDLAGVVEDYTRALAVRPDAQLRTARGWAYLVQAAPRLARIDFEEALRFAPEDGAARVGRGYARVQLGDVSGGGADADQALKRGPRTPRLLYSAARVFAQAAGRDVPRAAGRWRQRALDTLADALRALPAQERAAFWRDHVARDEAFDPVARSADFARLAQQYPAR
jgi:tetratricopeptide (TPR) repeat protein